MRLLGLLPLAFLSACATMIEGTTDNITVSTTPAGATCTIDRDGERVGAVAATPGSLSLSKSRKDLLVACVKEGFAPSSTTVASGFTGTTFANILAGGVIGLVVDAASGANSEYPKDIRLELAQQPRPAAAPLSSSMPGYLPVSYDPRPRPGL